VPGVRLSPGSSRLPCPGATVLFGLANPGRELVVEDSVAEVEGEAAFEVWEPPGPVDESVA